MSTDRNKELIHRGFEAINNRSLEYFDDFLAPGYVNHSMPAPAPGPEGFKQVIGMFIGAFPDFAITLDDVIGDGDTVAARGHWRGTHSSDFMGIPATGRQIDLEFIDMWKLRDGKATDNWVQMDMMALMRQLGVMQEPEGAAKEG